MEPMFMPIINQALRNAARNGHVEIVKYLITNGANVHANNNQALRNAALGGHLEVVKYLIEDHDANVNPEHDHVLSGAVEYGHLDVVKYLVSKGANVHARDDYALCCAVEYGHLEVVKYLVEDHGANVDDDPVRWAAYNGHVEVVKYLKTYNVSQFTKKHIDKQIHIEKLNQVLKGIRALPGIGIDYLYAFEHFNHLKTIY